MALSTDLIALLNKPSGIYRATIDNSQIANVAASTVFPLVIGFSKKGLFNSPVFCQDKTFFRNIFGGVDRSTENKGSWFHRTALELLETTPIIVLNLYNLKNDEPTDLNATLLTDENYDLTEYVALSGGFSFANQSKQNQVLTRLYDTKKFWFASDEKLNDFASLSQTDALLSFMNVGQRPCTILTRKANVTGFDIKAIDWYNSTDDIPEYVNQNDYISDYFIDVIVLQGDFTNYTSLKTDPVFGSFFDDDGLISNQLDAFLRLPQVPILGLYTGSMLIDFTDKNGQNQYIKTLVNADSSRTGVVMAINEEFIEDNIVSGLQLDVVGHNAYAGLQKALSDEIFNEIDFLSYNDKHIKYTTAKGLDVTNLISYMSFSGVANSTIVMTVPSTTSSVGFANLYSLVQQGEIGFGNTLEVNLTDGVKNDTVNLVVDSAEINANNAIITFRPYDWSTTTLDANGTIVVDNIQHEIITNIDSAEAKTYFSVSGTNGELVTMTIPTSPSAEFQTIRERALKGELSAGDYMIVDLEDALITVPSYNLVISNYEFNGNNELVLTFATIDYTSLGLDFNTTTISVGGFITLERISTVLKYYQTSFVEFFEVSTSGLAPNEIIVDNITYNSGTVAQIGGYLVSEYDNVNEVSRMTRITSITSELNGTFKITTELPIFTSGGKVIYTRDVLERFNNFNMLSLFGYRIKQRMLPNGTNQRINEIYNVIDDTNLFGSLIDRNQITYRYIVDTFNGGIEAASKNILTRLASQRSNAFAIINAPTMKEFENSSEPIFRDLPTSANPRPDLNIRYIPQGGNLQASPSFLYSLPSVDDGSSYGAFYTPNLVIRERNRNISVPPAMFVAKLFISKYTNARAWSTVSWERRGVLSGTNLVGIEYQFDETELGYLENFGLNPIVLKEGVGLMVTGNKTAQQNIKSSLSSINGTEVLIYIQDTLDTIISRYVQEQNSPENRLEIKTLVDQFLERVRVDGGILDYQTTMNSTNNTDDVIDNLFGVLDISIEISKNMERILHRTTILNTGEIASGLV